MPIDPRLAAILPLYPPAFRPRSGPISLGNAGGFSGASLWRFEAIAGPMAARAWPPGRTRAEVERVHGWLRCARSLGVLPLPVLANNGRTAQEAHGYVLEVAPWMPGAAERRSPPSIERVRNAFATLARFHLALAPEAVQAPAPGLAARLAEIEALPRNLASWEPIVAASPESEAKRLARGWIAGARRIGPRLLPEIRSASRRIVPVQPVIRDVRPDHFLFEGDRVSGLVDFGAMGPDPVAADLARLLSEWFEPEDSLRGEALASYQAVRPLAPVEEGLIAPVERSSALLAGARWIRWHFVEAIRFDDPSAVLLGLGRAVLKVARLDSGGWGGAE